MTLDSLMALLDVLLDLLTSCDLWWIWQAVSVYQVRPGSSIKIVDYGVREPQDLDVKAI